MNRYDDEEAEYLRRYPDRHEDNVTLWPYILVFVILAMLVMGRIFL